FFPHAAGDFKKFAERCRNDSTRSLRSTRWLKVIDADSRARLRTGQSHHLMSIEIRSRPCVATREPTESFSFKALMRFGFFLMIAAFVLMGAEVAYALYQLAYLML